jgi:hypothetical protein
LQALQFKIYQNIDTRLKGAVVQRVDQRTLNINADATTSKQQKEEIQKAAQLSMEEINAKIAELEQRSQRLASPTQRVRLEVGIETKRPSTAEVAEAEKTHGQGTRAGHERIEREVN